MKHNRLLSIIVTIAVVMMGIAVNGVLAAAQPIPGVDISAKKNPGGFPKKPSAIVHPTNKKCPAGYVFVDDGLDGACELLKDIAASTIPDAEPNSDSTSTSRLLPTVNKKTTAISPQPSGTSTKGTPLGAETGKSDSGGKSMQDSMMTR